MGTNKYKHSIVRLAKNGFSPVEIAARLGVKPTNHYKLPWADVLPPLVESGLTYIEIAARLGVSRITVNKHAARLGLKHIKSVSN
jgi:hypothetical protein